MSAENKQEPTVLTLDNKNSVQILSQYVELAQQKGAYLLNEAELLKRGIDVLANNVPDQEINQQLAIKLLIQGVVQGQKHGCYTLNDASLLNKVVQYVSSSYQLNTVPPPTETQSETPNNETDTEDILDEDVDEDDLTGLADPIPLKPKEV